MDVQSLSAIKKARASIEAKLEALGTSVGAKVDTLGTSLGGKMDNVIASVRALPATLDSKFAVTNGKVDAVSTSLTNIGTDINTLQGDVGRVESSVADVYAAASSNATNVSLKVVTTNAKDEVLSVTGSGYVYMIALCSTVGIESSVVTANFDGDFLNMRLSYNNGNYASGLFAGTANLSKCFRDTESRLPWITPFGNAYTFYESAFIDDYLNKDDTAYQPILSLDRIRFNTSFSVTSKNTCWLKIVYSLDE